MSIRASIGQFRWKLVQPRTRERARVILRSRQAKLISDIGKHLDETRSATGIEARECRFLSQNGEDGVLVGLIDLIQREPGRFLEFGFSIFENNCLAPALYHKLEGLYIDGSPDECREGTRLLDAIGESGIKVVNSFITCENINQLIADRGFGGELDILSIDIDGNDYWIWRALDVVQPRIVISEFNASFGSERSVTVPYEPAFDRMASHESGLHHGASIQALTNLGREKGYKLIGCDSFGLNLYFLRNDLEHAQLPQVDPRSVFRSHRARIARGLTQAAQEEIIFGLPLVEV